MRRTNILGLFCILLFAAGCDEGVRHTGYRAEPGYTGTGDVISSPTYRSSYPSTPSAAQRAEEAARAAREADAALVNSVRQQLDRYGDLAAASQSLQITARNGAVTLTGSVPSQRERGMIDAVARNTPGVSSVNNQLQVSTASQTYPNTTQTSQPYPNYGQPYGQSDQALANQLQQALVANPSLGSFASNVRVSVQNGRVTLSGNVPSEQDRRLVDEVVRNTRGVVSVTDQMQVGALPTGRYDQTTRVYPTGAGGQSFSLHVEGLNDADRALAQRILEDLRTDPAFAGSYAPIAINISGGRVTLQGAVSSFDEKRRIAEAMQRIAGVNNLDDELQVGPTGQ